jgi:hypothetical protein
MLREESYPPTIATQDKAFRSALDAHSAADRMKGGMTLTPGEGQVVTTTSAAPLQGSDVAAIKQGTKLLFHVTRVYWMDDNGSWYRDFCTYVIPDTITGSSIASVFANCATHNEIHGAQ